MLLQRAKTLHVEKTRVCVDRPLMCLQIVSVKYLVLVLVFLILVHSWTYNYCIILALINSEQYQ